MPFNLSQFGGHLELLGPSGTKGQFSVVWGVFEYVIQTNSLMTTIIRHIQITIQLYYEYY